MTTQYSAKVVVGTAHAFTVRPDLWPPGSRVRLRTHPGLEGRLAWWSPPGSSIWTQARPDPGSFKYEVPGLAEALVLAGQVMVTAAVGHSWTWTEVSP